jgi:uncharacterized membrane protein
MVDTPRTDTSASPVSGGSDPTNALYRTALAAEHATVLDPVVRALDSALPDSLRAGPVRDRLGGRWLGHALHPMLTDFPLGAWMSASLLDVLPGRKHEGAAERLLGFGLLAALPTIASGASDWLQAEQRERRVGVVHAATNAAATALYASSLVARRRGQRRAGVALGIAGGVVATVGGYFGGHLSTARDAALRSSAR